MTQTVATRHRASVRVFRSARPGAQDDVRGAVRDRPVKMVTVVLAGLAAGLTEVVWIVLVDAVSVVSAQAVAREVSATVFGPLGPMSVVLGVAVHLLLSVLIAALVARCVWQPTRRRAGPLIAFASCMIVLAGIWVVNVLVVLPVWNPAFVDQMPLWIAFVSKMLFGAALAWTLECRVTA